MAPLDDTTAAPAAAEAPAPQVIEDAAQLQAVIAQLEAPAPAVVADLPVGTLEALEARGTAQQEWVEVPSRGVRVQVRGISVQAYDDATAFAATWANVNGRPEGESFRGMLYMLAASIVDPPLCDADPDKAVAVLRGLGMVEVARLMGVMQRLSGLGGQFRAPVEAGNAEGRPPVVPAVAGEGAAQDAG